MSTKREKFSVLIPVYKNEKPEYFDEALKSIYTQTIKPNEVLICVDGPIGKELKDVIKKYQEKYPKITRAVFYSKNRGLGKTLADGINECKNEIIFRMDSDDISVKDRFEKQLGFISLKKYDLVGSNISEFDETMNVHTGDRIVPEKNQEIIEFSKRRNPVNHMSVVYKKSAVLEAGNYKHMPGFEDYYLWMRMLKNDGKFYNIQENLVRVRGGEELAKRRGGKKYTDNIRQFEKTLYTEKLISHGNYFVNIATRTIAALIPNRIRTIVYKLVLRTQNNSLATTRKNGITKHSTNNRCPSEAKR